MALYKGDFTKGEIEIKSTETKFSTPFFEFHQDKVTFPNDQKGEYTRIEPSIGGVVILPIDSDGHIILIKSFRHAIRSFSIEAPRGFMKKDERPIHAAMRELQEEIGVSAAEFIDMGMICPENSILNSKIHLFFAHDLIWQTSSKQSNSDPEAIDSTLCITKEKFKEMVITNEITDAYTLGLYAKVVILGYW